jgi:hypothetical protein
MTASPTEVLMQRQQSPRNHDVCLSRKRTFRRLSEEFERVARDLAASPVKAAVMFYRTCSLPGQSHVRIRHTKRLDAEDLVHLDSALVPQSI